MSFVDSNFIWTSHDIINNDGTVCLAASEPKVYNTKIGVDYNTFEGTKVDAGDGFYFWKILSKTLTDSEYETSVLAYKKLFEELQVITYYSSSILEDGKVTQFICKNGETELVFLVVNSPVTVEGSSFQEIGLYTLLNPYLPEGMFFYYNSL